MKKVNSILSAAILSIVLLSSCGGSSNEEKTSIEEKTTNEVTIGNQVWMTENLNVEKFRNGDPIPEAKTNEEWEMAGKNKQPAWCYYNNNSDNGDRFGKLYNWYAINDPRGLATEGWKIPSDEDWNRLTDFLGGVSVAGNKMKSTDFWADLDGETGNGSNESGFSGLPGGFRVDDGPFNYISKHGYWWSSSEVTTNEDEAWIFTLNYYYSNVDMYITDKKSGYSVRCIRD